jgi:hypothetical protein
MKVRAVCSYCGCRVPRKHLLKLRDQRVHRCESCGAHCRSLDSSAFVLVTGFGSLVALMLLAGWACSRFWSEGGFIGAMAAFWAWESVLVLLYPYIESFEPLVATLPPVRLRPARHLGRHMPRMWSDAAAVSQGRRSTLRCFMREPTISTPSSSPWNALVC